MKPTLNFFFFVHFADIDRAGHKHGENSKEYNDALISTDLWTGRIMTKIRECGLSDKTQFYITSDHGFNEDKKNHSFAPYVFLATNNKKVNRKGLRQDVAPTIMESFGLPLSQYIPALDGLSLTQPDNRLPAKITPETRKPDILYVATPQEVVEKMLEMAQVTKDDLVYDLGCGDGRIVVARQRYDEADASLLVFRLVPAEEVAGTAGDVPYNGQAPEDESPSGDAEDSTDRPGR